MCAFGQSTVAMPFHFSPVNLDDRLNHPERLLKCQIQRRLILDALLKLVNECGST
jgi:hypothetical protein